MRTLCLPYCIVLVATIVGGSKTLALTCSEVRAATIDQENAYARAAKDVERLEAAIQEEIQRQATFKDRLESDQRTAKLLGDGEKDFRRASELIYELEMFLTRQMQNSGALQVVNDGLRLSLGKAPSVPVSQHLEVILSEMGERLPSDEAKALAQLIELIERNEMEQEEWRRESARVLEEILEYQRPAVTALLKSSLSFARSALDRAEEFKAERDRRAKSATASEKEIASSKERINSYRNQIESQKGRMQQSILVRASIRDFSQKNYCGAGGVPPKPTDGWKQ